MVHLKVGGSNPGVGGRAWNRVGYAQRLADAERHVVKRPLPQEERLAVEVEGDDRARAVHVPEDLLELRIDRVHLHAGDGDEAVSRQRLEEEGDLVGLDVECHLELHDVEEVVGDALGRGLGGAVGEGEGRVGQAAGDRGRAAFDGGFRAAAADGRGLHG